MSTRRFLKIKLRRRENNETRMLEWYWNKVCSGTLCAEFPAVKKDKTHAKRDIDAVILPKEPHREVDEKEFSELLHGRDLVAVQAKANRLGMYLMGQTLFSALLIKKRPYNPSSVRAVALCKEGDPILCPLLISIGEQVGVDIQVKAHPDAKLSRMSEGTGRGGRRMIDWYWRNVWKDKGYTLEKNVQVGNETDTNAQQAVHAVIKKGRSVIVVHAKAGGNKKGKYQPYRLGMYLMGQALFGAELVKRKLKPRSVRSVALCDIDDGILRPILEDIGEKVVVKMEVVPVPKEIVVQSE